MIIAQSFRYEEILGLKFARKLIGPPKLWAHIYYIDGLLIDTGQRRARQAILKATGELEVQQILVTHHHEDHSGNIPALRELHRCDAYAPPLCCEMMKDPPPISYAQQMTWGKREPCHDLLPVGDILQTPHFHFQIIPIPGHAADMVALYEPDRKWLFSADLFLNSYISYYLYSERMAQQIVSIRKVLQLDFDTLLCSHNPKLTNGKERLQKKLDFLESFFDGVARLHHQGHKAREIFRELKLKEDWFLRTLSWGSLSKMNMVKSVIRDLEQGESNEL